MRVHTQNNRSIISIHLWHFVFFCCFYFFRNNKGIHSKLEQLWIVSNWKTIKWLILNFRGWFSFSLVFLLAVGDFFLLNFALHLRTVLISLLVIYRDININIIMCNVYKEIWHPCGPGYWYFRPRTDRMSLDTYLYLLLFVCVCVFYRHFAYNIAAISVLASRCSNCLSDIAYTISCHWYWFLHTKTFFFLFICVLFLDYIEHEIRWLDVEIDCTWPGRQSVAIGSNRIIQNVGYLTFDASPCFPVS